jgi:hypothetical protein
LSTGDNKPGMRNISDLKARLGMLNKNVGGKAADGGAVEVTADTDAELGMDTQVVRLPAGDAPRAEAPTPPAPTPAPAPPAPRPSVDTRPGPSPTATGTGFSPFALGNASELFKKPEPTPPPPPAPRAPAAPPPQQQAPAPPAEPSLDHPLQMGVFPDEPAVARASRPVEYTAEDKEFIASVEGVRGKSKKVIIGLSAFMLIVGLGLGSYIGHGKIQRQLVNAQIDRAVIVRDQILPQLEKFDAIVPTIERMTPGTVAWDIVEALPTPDQLQPIDVGAILGGRVPLSEEYMRVLGKAVTDLNAVFYLVREHRRITLDRDKAELEALEKGQSFESNHDYFAVLFEPVDPKTKPLDYRPPEGRIVAVTGKPHANEAGDANVIPIITRQGKEQEVPLQSVLVMPKAELFSGAGGVALKNYSRRVEELRRLTAEFRSMEDGLREVVQKEANRPKVWSF